MKEVTENERKYLSAMTLYLDDIEHLANVFRKKSKDNEVRINVTMDSRSYELDNIAELIKLQERASKLEKIHFKIRDPYISLDIEKGSADIYIAENDDSSIGMMQKVLKFLKKKRKHLYFLINYWWSIAFFNISLIVMAVAEEEGIESLEPVALVSFLSALLWGFFVWIIGKNTIYTKKRVELPNFFARNKDKIIISTIFLILGIVVKTIFDKYMN